MSVVTRGPTKKDIDVCPLTELFERRMPVPVRGYRRCPPFRTIAAPGPCILP